MPGVLIMNFTNAAGFAEWRRNSKHDLYKHKTTEDDPEKYSDKEQDSNPIF
jgi:hypothetical protein